MVRRLSQPPAWTLESCPESPIATTFTPDSTAAQITAADRRVCAIVASSRISTAGFWLIPRGGELVEEQQVRVAGQAVVPGVQGVRVGDPGAFFELAFGAAGRCRADDLEPGVLIDRAEHAGGGGLAGAGERFDGVDLVTGAGDAEHRAGLSLVEHQSGGGAAAYLGDHVLLIDQTEPNRAAVAGVRHDLLLALDQLDSRVQRFGRVIDLDDLTVGEEAVGHRLGLLKRARSRRCVRRRRRRRRRGDGTCWTGG